MDTKGMRLDLAGRRALVVGDVHGCFDELMQLVAVSGIGADDWVIGLGDLIDRGPKPRETVAWFARKPERRVCIRGNHEQKHLNCAGSRIWSLAGRIVREGMSKDDYEGMLAYFSGMPLWLDLGLCVAAHAGIEPGIAIGEQKPEVLMGVGSGRRPGFDGKSPWWFDSEKMQGCAPVLFGHEKHEQGVARGRYGNVWGLDTGASQGGKLTGLLLPEFRLVEVPAPDYWSVQKAKWLPSFAQSDLPEMKWDWIRECAAQSGEWPEPAKSMVAGALAELDAEVEQAKALALAYARKVNWGCATAQARRALAKAALDENPGLPGQLANAQLRGMDAMAEACRLCPTLGKLREARQAGQSRAFVR